MNLEKKKIIINEIHYWKNNKLLPDTYCNFLLALYTEGNHNEDVQLLSKTKNSGAKFLLLTLLALLLVITLLVIYFTELSFVLQMAIVVFLLLISIVVTAYFNKFGKIFQVPLSITLIQFLICSITFIEKISYNNQIWIAATVLGNCILWITLGKLYRMIYLVISGTIGIMILLGIIIL